VDFAPTGVSACNATTEWVTAMADGVIARSAPAEVMLDLDGDGDERTGWVIFYLHLASQNQPQAGQTFTAGQRLGHPSCEGGETTGTHIHIARKYNGEWILADSPTPFNMKGWIVHDGNTAYKGTLTRFSQTVTASNKSEFKSLLRRE
jgi:murein DD-endopeptidase MepM/ murein hydrolase activator NlpD